MTAEKTIRVSEETWRRLKDLKRSDESFDDVLTRLTTGDRWSGFGALSGTGVSDGTTEVHERLDLELREDVEETRP